VLLALVAALVILLATAAAAGVGLALLVGPLLRALDAPTGQIVRVADADLLWWSLAVLAVALVSDRLHR